MTGGEDDGSLTVPGDVEKPLKYIDGHLSAIDALHQGCYEQWVEKMPDEYMEKVDSILSDDSELRGRQEMREVLEGMEESLERFSRQVDDMNYRDRSIISALLGAVDSIKVAKNLLGEDGDL